MPFGTQASISVPVYVASVGACTSVGYNAPAAAAATRAGINMFHEHPYMVDRAGEKMIVARVEAMQADLDVSTRLFQLAAVAAEECLSPLRNLRFGSAPKISAVLGLPGARPGPRPDVASAAMERLDASRTRFGVAEFSFYPNGHSAGLMALQNGFSAIQRGQLDLCLVGGVHSYMDPDILEWLDETEQLHSKSNAWGFVPGEAAGFCLLATEAALRRYDLQPMLAIVAAASANETNLIRTDTVCLGEGLSAAVKQALTALPAEEKIHKTICDMNGESYRADELAFTICRTARRFVDSTDVLTPADCWGDVGAASGPLFVALAAAAARKQYASGPHTLLWTSSDTGERSAVILTAAGVA